jgi:DNA-binding response OmpR family regulator
MAKILVVDDEEHIVMILKDSLEFSGFQVITAYNGEEALEAVQKEHPDLIVLDIGMPKMDGWEVCRRLKGNDSTKTIPIIILTAYAQISDQKKGTSLGAERFISKPCDLTYLVEEINALLAQRASQTPKK